MSWLWFDLCPAPVPGAMASARASDGAGCPAGVVCAWPPGQDRPTSTAVKIDERAIDPSGSPGWVSLARGADGITLPFDDPAVAHAIRMVLALAPADVFTTLVHGDDRCVGSLTGTHGDRTDLAFDPFANMFPATVLRVEAGLLGQMPAPAGPVTQRYGADNPWPWDRFQPR